MIENQTRGRILFLVQLPPPLHGASLMNSFVINSKVIKSNYNIDVINLKFARSVKDISKFSFRKILKGLFYGFKIIKRILTYKPDLVYFNISLNRYAFYRDTYYVVLLKLFRKKIIYHLHTQGIKKILKTTNLRNICTSGCLINSCNLLIKKINC
jgi:hypothetical protein